MAKAMVPALVGSLLLVDCSVPFELRTSHKHTVTAVERVALLRRAQVWTPTNIAAMDIRRGPNHDGFRPGSTIFCDFVDEHFGGHTPKFGCAFNREDTVKVRYGRDNGEVYAGVAATRLLWALGFGADPLYPVHVVCRHCPEKVQREGTVIGEAVTFDVAAVERKFAGADIDAADVAHGWSWQELDMIDPSAGGAPTAHRDALKLLAVLLQHTDNKADQQRFVCRDSGRSKTDLAPCATPFLLIHDLGQTFGRANLLNRATVGSVDFELWSNTPVWKHGSRPCIGNLAASQTGTLSDPMISEAGRKFLARLLTQLTDEQLSDLFSIARFADKPHGGAPIQAWVAAFKHKRQEIVSAACP